MSGVKSFVWKGRCINNLWCENLYMIQNLCFEEEGKTQALYLGKEVSAE